MSIAAAPCLLRDLGEGEYFRYGKREGLKIHGTNGKNVIWLKNGKLGLLRREAVVEPMLDPESAARSVIDMFLVRSVQVFV